MVPQEVAQAAGCLQLRHVGMQIQAIDATDREGHVLADNVGDVGCDQNLLAEIPVMVLLTKDADAGIGPNINSDASPQTDPPQRSPQFLVGLRRSFTVTPSQGL
jgi:hypothetical protein